jgi:hypothetical protein
MGITHVWLVGKCSFAFPVMFGALFMQPRRTHTGLVRWIELWWLIPHVLCRTVTQVIWFCIVCYLEISRCHHVCQRQSQLEGFQLFAGPTPSPYMHASSTRQPSQCGLNSRERSARTRVRLVVVWHAAVPVGTICMLQSQLSARSMLPATRNDIQQDYVLLSHVALISFPDIGPVPQHRPDVFPLCTRFFTWNGRCHLG